MTVAAKNLVVSCCSALLCLLLLLASSSSSSSFAAAAAEPSSPPSDTLANVLTFTPEQVAAAEGALNASASAVMAAVDATRAAKAAFFQDAVVAPFGRLRAGGLRAGGLVKRSNRTEKADWLTSELALAPFARAFSTVSAAVESAAESSPVGKAFATTTKKNEASLSDAAAGRESSSSLPSLPTPRQILAKMGSELRLPGGGPLEDAAAAVSEAEKGGDAANAAPAVAAAPKAAVKP